MTDDEPWTKGLRQMEPFTITVDFGNQIPPPAATCLAEPCERCGACSTCRDFHFYGRGCTDECPLKAHQDDDDE